jgi:integration host factor subunit alpha
VALTKKDIVNAVAQNNGFSKKKSIETVEILIETMKSTLEKGEDVLITGFGKFCIQNKDERRGRNPATGEDLILKPRKRVAFKPSGKLREIING